MSLDQYVVLFFCCLDNQSRLKPVVWCMKCANFITKSGLRHFNILQRIKNQKDSHYDFGRGLYITPVRFLSCG